MGDGRNIFLALKTERIAVKVVGIDGFECASHPGEQDVGDLLLFPATAQVKIPVESTKINFLIVFVRRFAIYSVISFIIRAYTKTIMVMFEY